MTKLPLPPPNTAPHQEKEDDNGGTLKNTASLNARKRLKQNPSSVRWGSTSLCGGREEMESSTVALPHFLTFPPSMVGIDGGGGPDSVVTAHVFGVYDGHGGSQVNSVLHLHR